MRRTIKDDMSIAIECRLCGKQGYAETYDPDIAERQLTIEGWRVIKTEDEIVCACPSCVKENKS